MNSDEIPASGLKVLLTLAGSLLAAFVCGVMTVSAGGDAHVDTLQWWATWLVLVAVVVACSYSLLRDHRVSRGLAVVFAPLLAVAQFGAIAVVIYGILVTAL
jgi:pheromone shutdown protein TraB